MKDFKPLFDKVLVERIEKAPESQGSIILPETAKEKPQWAKVIAVGKGKLSPEGKIISPQVKPGDIIYIGKYSGIDMEKTYVIVSENEILGVLA